MMRRFVLLALVGVVAVACGSPDEHVGRVVEERGAYAADGASLTQGEVEAIHRNVRNAGGLLGVVVLADEPAGGATAYAEEVLNLAPSVDDVIVVTPQEFGAVSAVVPTIDAALVAASAGFERGGDAGLVAAYASIRYDATLDGADVIAGADGDIATPPTPPSTLWVVGFILLVLLVSGGIAVLMLRGFRKAKDEEVVDLARDEVREDLTAMADTLLDLDAEVSLADETTRERWAVASEIYTSAQDRLEQLDDLDALRDLDEEVELARWQLETIQSDLRGTTPPERPAPKPRPAVEDQRAMDQLEDDDRERVVGRQRRRRGDGVLGELLGGLVGGAIGGAARRSTWTPTRRTTSTSPRSSTRTRTSSRSRARSRGGRRK